MKRIYMSEFCNFVSLKRYPLAVGTVFVTSFMILLFVCFNSYARNEKTIKGTIYLGGEIFGKVNLESKKWEAVYKGLNRIYCEFPNFVKENIFILETQGIQIEYFDATRDEFTFIISGVAPLYIPEVGSIFFYRNKQGLFQKVLSDNSTEMFITPNVYFGSSSNRREEMYHGPPPIKISSEEIAYYGKDKKIEVYNYIKKKFRTLAVTGFEPLAYYDNKNSLICRNTLNESLCFVNTTSSNTEKISIYNPKLVQSGIISISNYGCLIYSKYRSWPFWEGEYKDTYIYWVNDKREEMTIENCDTSYGLYDSQ
jgi:hypothetical protein